MTEEYYIEYYSPNGHRHYTVYYATRKEVEIVAKNLEEQGYKDVSIKTFRY